MRRNKNLMIAVMICFCFIAGSISIRDLGQEIAFASLDEDDFDLEDIKTLATISNVTKYNISDYTVYNGTYVSGIGNMNESDATNATFIEAKYAGPGSDSNVTIHTDNVTKWSTDGMFNTLICDTVQDQDGDGYSIRATTTSNTGDARFIYDNGTTKAMGLDVSDMVKVNYTVRTDAVDNQITFSIFRLHNSDTKYYTHTFDINLLQNTWTVFEDNYATVTAVGGMTSSDSVNWIEWIFTPIKNNKDIWVDAGMFYSTTAGVDQRLLNTSLQFSGIADFDHYVCNISAYRTFDSEYYDDFFSEDHTKWGSDAPITLSRDTTDAQEGVYRIIKTFDASANATFWFDNSTGKNMQVDWSNYNKVILTHWGNASFTLDYGRLYTDSSNYFHADVEVTHTTVPGEVRVPLTVFTEVGSPTWSNISWIEWKINNIDNPNPLKMYIDNMYVSTGGEILFDSVDEEDSEEQTIKHAHTYINYTMSLNAITLQTNGYVNITLNDGKIAGDLTNTTIDIDLLQITAWNTTNTCPVVDTGPVCTNLDDTDNIYGRYKTYIFTVNVSDADGFADIHYVNFSFLHIDLSDIYETVRYNSTSDVFDCPTDTYIIINQTASSAVRSGNYVNITFGLDIRLCIDFSVTNIPSNTSVVDDSGMVDYQVDANTWDFSSEIRGCNLVLSDDRGNPGQELTFSGTICYYHSPTNLIPPSEWVDVWITGPVSDKSDLTIGTGGEFEVTGIETTTTVGLNTFTLCVVRNGTGAAGSCLCHTCSTKTYISDRITITLDSENVFEYKNGGPATIAISATYEYDGATVTGYSMTFSEDGNALSGTYTQADPFYKPIRYGVSSAFTTNTFTDTIYGITLFTSDSLDLKWVGTDPDRPPATGTTPEPDIEPDVFGGGGGWLDLVWNIYYGDWICGDIWIWSI